jgi:hypothetical protein
MLAVSKMAKKAELLVTLYSILQVRGGLRIHRSPLVELDCLTVGSLVSPVGETRLGTLCIFIKLGGFISLTIIYY